MQGLTPEMQEKLAKLKKEYTDKLSGKFQQILGIKNEIRENNLNEDNLNKLYYAVHSLAGSSAIFGFTEISEVSSNIEVFIKELSNDKTKITAKYTEKIVRLICDLEMTYINSVK